MMGEGPNELLFRSEEGDFLQIALGPRENDGVVNGYDLISRRARVTVQCGPFTCAVDKWLMTEELIAFLDQLIELHASLSGSAVLGDGYERSLQLELQGVGRGHLRVRGSLTDYRRPECSGTLKFEFETDQSFLQPAMNTVRHLRRDIAPEAVKTYLRAVPGNVATEQSSTNTLSRLRKVWKVGFRRP